jgi:putative ABC transport system permease protein
MSFVSAIRVALNALLVNKGRSMLTSLGIVISISAVIAIVSHRSAGYKLPHDRIERLGNNLILIRAGAPTQQDLVADSTPLKREDAAAIQKQVGPLLLGVAEAAVRQRIVWTATTNHVTALVGSTPDMEKIRNWKMAYGNFYTEEDVQQAAPVCLLGQTARKKLFPEKLNPVGELVRVARVQLRIIGVLEEKGRSPTGADQDDQIFLPITTLQRQITGDDNITIIMTATKSEALVKKAKEEIIPRNYQREYRRLRRTGDDCTTPGTTPVPLEFRLQTAADVMALLEEQVNAVRSEPEAKALEKARTVGYLAGIALKAIEAGNMAARLEALEAVLKQRNGEAKR